MRHKIRNKKWVCMAMLLVMIFTTVGFLKPFSNAYEIVWWTVDSGGHMLSEGEGYRLRGTIGQSDAGVLSGGEYTLAGGFWRGGALAKYGIYLPVLIR